MEVQSEFDEPRPQFESEREDNLKAATDTQFRLAFRPRARLLQLLGDELIGNPRLAVFELVKNAYDADANHVIVTLDLRSLQNPSIKVVDDGEGMTIDTIRDVWLVPG